MTVHARELRRLLEKPDILVVPGGGAPLDFLLLEQAGFAAGYVSGYATAAARHGLPDIGLTAYAEIEEMVRAVRRVSDLPLIVDCDTGYGDAANVRHTVQGLERLGVAAIQIEDQVWPKRCGHMDGKSVEPLDVAVRKIRAAVAGRTIPETVIIARTDARGPQGLDDALARCRAFKEAGADVLFVDGPESVDELKAIGEALPGPILANMSETGKTPLRSASELQDLGYAIALFPSSTVRVCIRAMSEFLADLKAKGDSRPWLERMASLEETNRVLWLDSVRDFDKRIASGE